MFGVRGAGVTGEWSILHSEELNGTYCLMICTA
jgi:hypothetical protein